MDLTTVLQPLVPLALGLVLGMLGIIGRDGARSLRIFVVRVCVPLLVFFSISEATANDWSVVAPMIGGFLLLVGALFLVGWLAALTQQDPARRAAVHLCCTFGNYGWLGLGVIGTLLGGAGRQHVVYFILAWWPVFYGVGLLVGFIHHRDGVAGAIPLREVGGIVAATVVALVAGLVLNATGRVLPPVLDASLRPFANMTVPLILFSVGLTLDLREMRGSLVPALVVSGVVLVLGPLLGRLIAGVIAPTAIAWNVLVLEGAMPVATTTPILEECYPLDMGIVGTSITVSTLLSLVTMPVVAHILL
jgi:hypothetical protein